VASLVGALALVCAACLVWTACDLLLLNGLRGAPSRSAAKPEAPSLLQLACDGRDSADCESLCQFLADLGMAAHLQPPSGGSPNVTVAVASNRCQVQVGRSCESYDGYCGPADVDFPRSVDARWNFAVVLFLAIVSRSNVAAAWVSPLAESILERTGVASNSNVQHVCRSMLLTHLALCRQDRDQLRTAYDRHRYQTPSIPVPWRAIVLQQEALVSLMMVDQEPGLAAAFRGLECMRQLRLLPLTPDGPHQWAETGLRSAISRYGATTVRQLEVLKATRAANPQAANQAAISP
jgi:hypothetical protein